MIVVCFFFFFFFSSRRRHTRLTCDWSSDVCSSDLVWKAGGSEDARPGPRDPGGGAVIAGAITLARAEGGEGADFFQRGAARSEERRVGKECRSRWARDH